MEKRAIIINPHDDDGVIAVGGIIIQLLDKSWKIKYIQLTDGRHGSNLMGPEETKKVRAKEIRAEMKFLGVDSYYTYDIEDGTLSSLNEKKKGLVSRLTNQIRDFKASVVFIPSEFEDHQDHRAAYALAHECISGLKEKVLEARYSVWSIPFKEHVPNPFDRLMIVDITKEMEKKKEAIKLHTSQEKEGRYSIMAEDINDYLAKLYSSYKPFELGKVEVLAITNVNDNYETFVKDLTNVIDVTNVFHGRSTEKISS